MVGVQYAGVAFVPFVVAAIAAVLRKWRLVIAALLVYPLKLIVEKVVLKEIVYRPRPGTSEPDAVLRHVPAHGPSFPSGHAIVAFALAGIVAPYLSRGWRIAAYVARGRRWRSPASTSAPTIRSTCWPAPRPGSVIAAVLNLLLLPHHASAPATAPEPASRTS